MRLSGLQKEVLSLYRQCLRECRKKPDTARQHFKSFARNEFDKNMGIEKRDFAAVEFLLRKGRRQLEMYSSPGVKNIH
ncbi:complex 1 protein-domain-containing protein [Bombardia bombarda]|uniref:Complex 1 protein-domain-containing protein n=1 Tax=Bombardia bombarda TaxID=252184 RepID=A0AA39X9Z1_9PEZI|nr:complex 1 protein-domain-containing protein [Bombardia bombarda]